LYKPASGLADMSDWFSRLTTYDRLLPEVDSQKIFHHRGHGGHREKRTIVKYVADAINK